MARCLSAYHWAEDRLNGEVPYQSADVLVEDSDIDESPSTKADRIRRREAIGRRYLLGYVPLIQTASLRGPFSSKSGWVSPWKGIQKPREARKSIRRREEFEAVSNREAQNTHSETLSLHNTTGTHVDEAVNGNVDEQIDDDAVPYDADNEGENCEQRSSGGQRLPNHRGHVVIGQQQGTNMSYSAKQCLNSDGNQPKLSGKNLERQVEYKSTSSSAGTEEPLSQIIKKRQVDMSWLKGSNVQKRSRYEALEHLSPTPAAGLFKEDNRGHQSRLPLEKSGSKTPKGVEQPQVSQKPGIYQVRAKGESTDNTSTPPVTFDEQVELFSKDTAESTHSLLMGGTQINNCSSHKNVAVPCSNASCLAGISLSVSQSSQNDKSARLSRTGLAGFNITSSDDEFQSERRWNSTTIASRKSARNVCSVFEEMNHNELQQDDVHRQPRVSELAIGNAILPNAIQTPWRCEVEVVQLSPSDLAVEDIDHLCAVRRRSHQGARSVTQPAKDQLFNIAYENSATTECLEDVPIISPQLNGTMTFSESTPPASEESFQYRRTDRNLNKRHSGNQEAGNTETTALALQTMGSHMHNLKASTCFSSSKGAVAQEHATDSSWKRDRKRQSSSKSSQGNLKILDELYRLSSPEPLGDDFEDDCKQQSGPPDINTDTTQNVAEQFDPGNVDMGSQRTRITQAKPKSCQLSNETPPALRGRPQLLISQASKDNMEPPKTSILPAQHPLSDSHAEQSLLLGKVKNPGRRGFDFSSRSPSQPESPKIDHSPIELQQDLQKPVPLITEPAEPVLTRELRSRRELFRGDASSSEITPAPVIAQAMQELPKSAQSPWTNFDVVPLQHVPFPGFQAGDSDWEGKGRVTRRNCEKLLIEKTGSEKLSFKSEEKMGSDDAKRNEKDEMRIFGTIIDYSPLSIEMGHIGAHFPSTQTLVNATTINPWGSAFKRPKAQKVDKRVSFGPLVSEGAEDYDIRSSSRPPLRMESPPPANIPRLTQLDDPFHNRLKAIRNLEVTGRSSKNCMNTPCDDIRKHGAKPLNSPATEAMAEAFIAADLHGFSRKVGIKGASDHAKRAFAATNGTENIIQPQTREVPAQQELKISSPPDASFSIAPCGKVTAVNMETLGLDAEDNFQAVLEDMGSFLEGWDVESEMKKAKGPKNNDIKGQRKRGYLSGISNR